MEMKIEIESIKTTYNTGYLSEEVSYEVIYECNGEKYTYLMYTDADNLISYEELINRIKYTEQLRYIENADISILTIDRTFDGSRNLIFYKVNYKINNKNCKPFVTTSSFDNKISDEELIKMIKDSLE